MIKKTAKKTPDLTKEIEVTVKELLDKLDVSAKIAVSPQENDGKSKDSQETDQDHFRVDIDTVESGLLIGHHGETINSLQLLLGIILYKKHKKWLRVILDVGDYRKKREESVKEMVNRIISEVEATKQPVWLPFLTPLERRAVHIMLADHKTVTSESVGEGRERRITIKPR